MVLVIAVLYHLRYELDCQYNANNTGDATLYFPDQRGELLGSGRNGGNVILITGGTILFTPQNVQLLTRRHLIGISKVACWRRKCA